MKDANIKQKLSELESRIKSLEDSLGTKAVKQSVSDLQWKNRVEQARIQRHRATRQILDETFGMIDKKRAKQWLAKIEEGRNAWK